MPGSRKTSRLRERATDRALSALAEELAALSAPERAPLGLAPFVERALTALSSMRPSSARARELRFVVRRLRSEDTDALRAFLDARDGRTAAGAARLQVLEVARERMLGGDDDAVERWLSEHPSAERQRLRQLVRAARKERADAATRNAQPAAEAAQTAALGAIEPVTGAIPAKAPSSARRRLFRYLRTHDAEPREPGEPREPLPPGADRA